MDTTYVAGYLTFGPRQIDGWPAFVDEEGKAFATERVKAALDKYGRVDLDLAQRCIFEGQRPECLKNIGTWDAIYAVAHRALLAVGAKQVFIHEGMESRKEKAKEYTVLDTHGPLVLAQHKDGFFGIYQKIGDDTFIHPEHVGKEGYIRHLWKKYKEGKKGFLDFSGK